MNVPKPVQFKTQHRAKFSELDPYGHLNTTCYLSYFLDHRFTGLRELGLDLKTLAALPVAFYVKDVILSMHRSVRGDQKFHIHSAVKDFGETHCQVTCEMSNAKGERLATCELVLVCIDKVSSQPCRWPDDVKKRFFEET